MNHAYGNRGPGICQQTGILRSGLNKGTEVLLSTQKPLEGRIFTCRGASLECKWIFVFGKSLWKQKTKKQKTLCWPVGHKTFPASGTLDFKLSYDVFSCINLLLKTHCLCSRSFILSNYRTADTILETPYVRSVHALQFSLCLRSDLGRVKSNRKCSRAHLSVFLMNRLSVTTPCRGPYITGFFCLHVEKALQRGPSEHCFQHLNRNGKALLTFSIMIYLGLNVVTWSWSHQKNSFEHGDHRVIFQETRHHS